MPPALAQARGLAELVALPVGFALDRMADPAPAFLTRAGNGARLTACTARRDCTGRGQRRTVVPALRHARRRVAHLAEFAGAGKMSHAAALRTWYDVHRFRSSPQNQELGDAAVTEGGVRFIAARLQAVPAADEGRSIAVTWKRLGAELPQTQSFDAVINCTSLDALVALSADPFLLSATQRGWLRRDACSMVLRSTTSAARWVRTAPRSRLCASSAHRR